MGQRALTSVPRSHPTPREALEGAQIALPLLHREPERTAGFVGLALLLGLPDDLSVLGSEPGVEVGGKALEFWGEWHLTVPSGGQCLDCSHTAVRVTGGPAHNASRDAWPSLNGCPALTCSS